MEDSLTALAACSPANQLTHVSSPGQWPAPDDSTSDDSEDEPPPPKAAEPDPKKKAKPKKAIAAHCVGLLMR